LYNSLLKYFDARIGLPVNNKLSEEFKL